MARRQSVALKVLFHLNILVNNHVLLSSDAPTTGQTLSPRPTVTKQGLTQCTGGGPYLFTPVDDVLGETESAGTGSADHAVVTGRRVCHLHRGKLQERLAQRGAAHEQLPANATGHTHTSAAILSHGVKMLAEVGYNTTSV